MEQRTINRLEHRLDQARVQIENLNDIRSNLADRAVIAEFRLRELSEACEAWISSGDPGPPPADISDLLRRLKRESHGQHRSPYA